MPLDTFPVKILVIIYYHNVLPYEYLFRINEMFSLPLS